ncbi:unnamed protein product [Larinioides sclopetarius]|uniref:Uncharacterized protein n=1 Tax=Larinioides sclopetarius TaxID=280406 RepID=A0AAV2AYZ5_9ARAC
MLSHLSFVPSEGHVSISELLEESNFLRASGQLLKMGDN